MNVPKHCLSTGVADVLIAAESRPLPLRLYVPPLKTLSARYRWVDTEFVPPVCVKA